MAAGSGAAWTYRGKAVPTSDRGDFWPPKAAAVFPDYRIRGPIFVVCGGHDSEWPSCPFSRAIVSQLRDHHFRYPYRLLAFPAAGHWVNGLVPNYLGWVQGDGSAKPDADGRAYADLWPKLLAFMATTSRP